MEKQLVRNNKGFTLIELLIVIVIIVIMVGIGAVSYTTVLKNSRDSQRRSDLKKIAQALEAFYSDNKYYPTAANLSGCLTGTSCTLNNGNASTTVYIKALPADPQGSSGDYQYTIDLSSDSTFPGVDYQKYTLSFAKYEGTIPPEFSPLKSPNQ